MSDADLRALQRRWRETGDPSAEEAYVHAALRAGELTRAQVELSAWLDDPVAARVLGWASPAGDVSQVGDPQLAQEAREAATAPPSALDAWTRGLARFDVGPGLRAPGLPAEGWGSPLLLGACGVALEWVLERAPAVESGAAPRRALAALSAYRDTASSAPPAGLLLETVYAYESSAEGSPEERAALVASLALGQACTSDAVRLVSRALMAWLGINRASAQRALYVPGQVAAVALTAAVHADPHAARALRERVAEVLRAETKSW